MEAKLVEGAYCADLERDWNSLVAQSEHSGFMQSLAWSKFKTAQGLQPLFITLTDGGQLLGGAIFHRVANTKNASILIAADGPILPWSEPERAEQGLNLIRQSVETYARENNVIGMRIEPRLIGNTPIMAEFGKAPLDLNPRETLVISLEPSEQDLLQSFKSKCRYNIRIAQRKGVEVFEDIRADAVHNFHRIMTAAANRDRFAVEPIGFFYKLIETLQSENMVNLLFAEHEGDLLGTLLMIRFGGRATYLYGGISNDKRNLMAGYALQWQAMLLAKNSGCTSYDFYGLDEFESPNHPYARFSRFKKGFGGEVVRTIGAHDYFFMEPLTDAVMRAMLEVSWTADAVV